MRFCPALSFDLAFASVRRGAALLMACAGLALASQAGAQICNNPASCLAIHPTPGCNSLACCNLVCSIDPSCCGTGGWDAACVLVANQSCVGYPGAAASGSCYTPHKNPNCDNAACCTAVCAFDPFCCSETWDFTCTQYAGFACPGTPGTCGTPSAGSCFTPHSTGACDDLSCCNAVCNVDPSCCGVAWDALCVIAAEQICQPGCEPTADPNASSEVEACSSRSNDPCYVATGGTPETMLPNIQIKGAIGAFVPSSAQPDVDVFTITIPDTDGDGLAKVSLAFASSPKAWAALVPAQACAPMSSALMQVSSELCVDTVSAASCIPAGNYRVVVGGGTFPQFGGSAVNCSTANRYTIRVDVSQACGNPCASATNSCFVGGSARGCVTASCCASVCAADNFCCDTGWDASCVELAGNLCLSGPPANDLCANAINLQPGPQLFNTVRAALELGQNTSACGGANFSRDVWYRWTSDRQGAVEISVCNPWFDTVLAVYTGTCAKPAILACNDNAPFCGALGSRVTFTATCGATYLIRVGPRAGAGGEATISIASSAPVCVNCPADINRDGQVGAPDLAALLSAWGTPAGDLNSDGTTNAQDLASMLAAWGPCP